MTCSSLLYIKAAIPTTNTKNSSREIIPIFAAVVLAFVVLDILLVDTPFVVVTGA
jgi:hypothetical protein